MPSIKNTHDSRAHTVDEVARLLGLSRGSAYEAVRTGQIRSLTIGPRIVIPPSAVTELLGYEPGPRTCRCVLFGRPGDIAQIW